MARVLITEELAATGLDALSSAGHEVDVQLGLSPADLLVAIKGAEALIVRSATKVTADVLAAGDQLAVVGRAGVGIDNIDVAEATRRGVMVVNAPQSNSLSNAEHTVALLLAQARNIPQADAALKAGRWERSRWEGVELHGKTLGLLGLGRVGTLVAQRANSFGMRIVAWDPWTSPDRARKMGVELLELDELIGRVDFLSIHLLKTAESVGLVGAELLAKAKPGLRIVNTARGGIVDEAALAAAIAAGQVAGAAIDVFAEEPTTASPLFERPEVVVTPHLGASTREAQDKAGEQIAEQVVLALGGEFVPFAVNVSAHEASETVRPFVPLAERLGQLFAGLLGSIPDVLEVEYQGAIADFDVSLATLSVLRGVLGTSTGEPVSFVNAPGVAAERGLEVKEIKVTTAHDHLNLLTLRAGDRSIAGTLTGVRGEPRIVAVDAINVEVPPARHMLVVRNDDRVGMLAKVFTTLADASINVADSHLGRVPGGAAIIVIATDSAVPVEVIAALGATPGILTVHALAG